MLIGGFFRGSRDGRRRFRRRGRNQLAVGAIVAHSQIERHLAGERRMEAFRGSGFEKLRDQQSSIVLEPAPQRRPIPITANHVAYWPAM